MDDTGFLGFDTDALGYTLAEQPHPDAYFDPMYRSRHGPKPMDGWRFAIRCAAGCHDGVGSMSATRDTASVSEEECPECGGPAEIFNPDAEDRLVQPCHADVLLQLANAPDLSDGDHGS